MCELPSNAVIADQFLDHFDGFSIGSSDMTQLTLGLDRDSALVAAGFDERDPAVKFMRSAAIKACKACGTYVGICGQGPSDYPDLAAWLVDQGIDTLSLIPRYRRRHVEPARHPVTQACVYPTDRPGPPFIATLARSRSAAPGRRFDKAGWCCNAQISRQNQWRVQRIKLEDFFFQES